MSWARVRSPEEPAAQQLLPQAQLQQAAQALGLGKAPIVAGKWLGGEGEGRGEGEVGPAFRFFSTA